MPFLNAEPPVPGSADIAVAGTGFAASFFLHRLLQDLPPDGSDLVFERGGHRDHWIRIEERHDPPEKPKDLFHSVGKAPKPWGFSTGFGGSSNCWAGNTPRMLPGDFEIGSRYGLGRDWPFGYDQIEAFYAEAERLMQISGSGGPLPMSVTHSLPPHRLSDPDRLQQQAWPGQYFSMPTARASRSTARRPHFRANGVCTLCPIDAMFTVLNGMAQVYEDPR
jgi:choline dehydrogenase-like flavoprotein